MSAGRIGSRFPIALLGLACLLSTPIDVAAASGGTFMRFQRIVIVDSTGFGQPIEVARLLIPAGWKWRGGTRWVMENLMCPPNAVQFSLSVLSPDGTAGLELFPDYVWTWNDDPVTQQLTAQQAAAGQQRCPFQAPMEAQKFLQQMLLPGYRRGAQVRSYQPLPDLVRAAIAQAQPQLEQQSRFTGVRQRAQGDAGLATIGFNVDGRAVEESILVTWGGVITAANCGNDIAQGSMVPRCSHYAMRTSNLIAVRAPQGMLPQYRELYGVMLASMKYNPAYSAAVLQFIAGLNGGLAMGDAERAKIIRDAQSASFETYRGAVQAQQASQSRLAQQFSESVRGVQTYRDPLSGQDVQLSAGYSHVFSNGRGEYILSNDALFNPSVTLRERWEAIGPMR